MIVIVCRHGTEVWAALRNLILPTPCRVGRATIFSHWFDIIRSDLRIVTGTMTENCFYGGSSNWEETNSPLLVTDCLDISD